MVTSAHVHEDFYCFFQIARQEGRVILTSGLPYQTVSVQSFWHFSGIVSLRGLGCTV